MAQHEESNGILSHEELKYQEHTRRASDFIKIDLFRSARQEFKLALNYRPEDPFSQSKIEECNGYIRRDRVKVLVIVPIVLVLIATVIMLNI